LETLEDRCLFSALTGASALAANAGPLGAAVASAYQQGNLVGYQPGAGHFTDPNLNGWGMAGMPDGSFAVANPFSTGLVTFYDRSGHVLPRTITVPASTSKPFGPVGQPAGVVYNDTSDFIISAHGKSAPARLIIDSIDGVISGWNPDVDATHAIVLQDTFAAGNPSVYTGLDIAQNSHGQNVLYAADIIQNRVEMFDRKFNVIGSFTDPTATNVDAGFGAWSVSAMDDKLYVTFANPFSSSSGPHGGVVDVFNTDGKLLTPSHFAANAPGAGPLENPWGITQAPANFGAYSNDILIGNVAGAGHINAFDPVTGAYLGQLHQPNGAPIAITGLWDLEFGDGTPDSGRTNQLFFDAGPNAPGISGYGLFGVIRAAGNPGGNSAAISGPDKMTVENSNAGGTFTVALAPNTSLSPSVKSSSHGHGGSGGGSGGGTGSGTFYPTASNVTQLVADITYADAIGGTFTINLAPNTTFDFLGGNDGVYGYGISALPLIGGPKSVNLTIIGNGDTIQRDLNSQGQFRLIRVAPDSALTLNQLTLQNGYDYAFNGGCIYNQGQLTISGCTLSNNTSWYSGYMYPLVGGRGGAIYNNGGTVMISDSTLSNNLVLNGGAVGGAICNDSGIVTIFHSTLYGNNGTNSGGAIYNNGTLSIDNSILSNNTAPGFDGGDYSFSGYGGGIYNTAGGTVTVKNSSRIQGNTVNGFGADVYNLGVLYLDYTSTVGIRDGNLAIVI
jgi:uncharacterized protein (TIGR03118 family)